MWFLFCFWVFYSQRTTHTFSPSPGVYSSLSSSAGSGSPRSQTLQYPILSAIWPTWIPEDWRLWFCQAAQSREWAAHDTLLHSQLCRSRGVCVCVCVCVCVSLARIVQLYIGSENTWVSFPDHQYGSLGSQNETVKALDTEVCRSSRIVEKPMEHICVKAHYPFDYYLFHIWLFCSQAICKANVIPVWVTFCSVLLHTHMVPMTVVSCSSGIEEAGLRRCHWYLESWCTPLHNAGRVGSTVLSYNMNRWQRRQCA